MNKPPILSEDRINEILYPEWRNEGVEPSYRDVAQAQRDADLKWFKEEVEKMVLPKYKKSWDSDGESITDVFEPVSPEDTRQTILSLLAKE